MSRYCGFRKLFLLTLFALPIFINQQTFADGKVFPKRMQKVPPSIPSQRAILSYRDGIEKLVIESSIDGGGTEFGWVIPLPSQPTKFKQVSSGLIETMSLNIQPKIENGDSHAPFLGISFSITVLVILLCYMKLRNAPRNHYRIVLFLLIGSILFLILIPTLSSAGLGLNLSELEGVDVLETSIIGNYEVAVLKADDPNALASWLNTNDFVGLSEQDRNIVDSYINENWYFVVAKLKRDADGYSSPHPVSLTFPTEKAVYPMKLTSTVGSNVYLEIFVIADESADCKQLTREVVNEYSYQKVGKYWIRSDKQEIYGFNDENFKQHIGHSGAKDFMWDGCFVTKLTGILTSKQMKDDLYLNFSKAEPFRKHYYSFKGARIFTILICSNVCSLLILLLTSKIINNKNFTKYRTADSLKRVFSPALFISFLIGTFIFLCLPKINAKTSGDIWMIAYFFRTDKMFDSIDGLAEKTNYFDGMNKDAVSNMIDIFFDDYNDHYTNEKVEYGDSPWNYEIIEDYRGIVFRFYDRYGFAEDYVLTSKP